jgi:pimeloyl-ACP methyl ester carboxylesterase
MMKFAAARGNVRIGFDVIGRGVPVTLLHDFGENSGFWYESGWVKGCLARGRQVILVDLRGHGDSSTPVDARACEPIHCCWDVVAVLDQAGIGRTDVLGVGVGGRVALCLAAFAPARVHAAAAGGAHPFAERAKLSTAAVDSWRSGISAKLANGHPAGNAPGVLEAAGESDWPDISDAVARSGVPILLFVGTDEPRCSLIMSFAEQAGAKLLLRPERKVTPNGEPALLTHILDFFDDPATTALPRLPPCLWSGIWG